MNKCSILALFLVLNSTNTFAKNHMLIMGGGGEGSKDSTIFDKGIEKFGKIAKRPGWEVSMAFNGGHAVTENLMEKHIPDTVKKYPNFSKENYDKMLQDTIAKIKNGEIEKGETLYMFIFTHGAEPTQKETSHKISLSSPKEITNYQSLEGLDTVSMDSLEELMLLTKEKGILLGITDMSCFGGSTLKLKEKLNLDNACITSSSGENNPAFASNFSFGQRFLSEAGKGGTVEDAFLKTRDNTLIGDYPMISTDIGRTIQEASLSQFEPYMSFDMAAVGLIPVARRAMQIANDEVLSCQKEDDFNQLIAQIENLKNSTSSVRFIKKWKLKKLTEALEFYKKMQDELTENFRGFDAKSLQEEITFEFELIDPVTKNKLPPATYTREEFYSFNFKALKESYLKTQESERTADDDIKMKKYEALENFVKKISKEDPQYSKFKSAQARFAEKEFDQITASLLVNFFEKDFYNLEYKKMKKEMKKNKSLDLNDPCRKIRF